MSPGSYLKSTERLQYMEYQLSAPSKVPESATPQPEEPLQINMPTPVTTALMAGSAGGGGVVPAPAPPVATPAVAPPQPKFGYHEINVMSLAGLVPHTAISEHVRGRGGARWRVGSTRLGDLNLCKVYRIFFN